MNYAKVLDTYLGILEDDKLELCKGYIIQDYISLYNLERPEASLLMTLVQDNFDPDTQIELDQIPAICFKQYFKDSIHNGWDGFEKEHQPILMLLVADIKRYFRMESNFYGVKNATDSKTH
jgi:hypothetical protein